MPYLGKISEHSEFGYWVSTIKKSRNMSCEKLGLQCGVDSHAISSYCTGKNYPSIMTLIRLREGVHLTDEEFIQAIDALTADLYEAGKLDLLLDD